MHVSGHTAPCLTQWRAMLSAYVDTLLGGLEVAQLSTDGNRQVHAHALAWPVAHTAVY